MSFQTILTISLVTEAVVMFAIVSTLLNAFSDGRLYAAVASLWRPAAKTVSAPAREGALSEQSPHTDDLRRAA